MSTLHFRFPPFPLPPPDISITPFAQFAPQGYVLVRTSNGDMIEVDASARVPTLKIDTEEEVARKKKEKKKKRCAGRCMDENGRLVPWWEEWELGEEQRGLSFDPVAAMDCRDRLYLAAEDFRLGRTWPAQGVRPIWDRFRLYIGLLSSMPVYSRIKAHRDNPTIPYDQDDAEDDIPRAHPTHVRIQASTSDASNTEMPTIQDTLEQGSQPGKSTLPNYDDPTSLECSRLDAFIAAISKGTKIFLSSYLRETDLIWTESNLVVAPMLLKFFLKFLKRTGLFWDLGENMGQEVENAIGFAEKAVVELPLTARLGRAIPGRLERGFVGLWGKKFVGVSMTVTSEGGDSLSPATDENFGTSSTDSTAKDDASWTDIPPPTLFQILGPTTLPLAYTTAIFETGTRRIREVVMPGSHLIDGTGSSDSISSLDNRVGSGLAAAPEAGGRESTKIYGLEEALEARLAIVILEPWVSSEDEVVDTSEIGKPAVGCTYCAISISIGAENSSSGMSSGEKVDRVSCPHICAHNPYTDIISVLVDLANVELFNKGMGMCGTWVRLRRIENVNSSGTVDREGGNRKEHGYWYIEDLTAVFPSFHTDGDGVLGGYLEGELDDEGGGDGDDLDM